MFGNVGTCMPMQGTTAMDVHDRERQNEWTPRLLALHARRFILGMPGWLSYAHDPRSWP